jgi:hypothetical protein
MGEEEFVNQIRFMFSSEEAKGLFDRMEIVPNDKEPKSIILAVEGAGEKGIAMLTIHRIIKGRLNASTRLKLV